RLSTSFAAGARRRGWLGRARPRRQTGPIWVTLCCGKLSPDSTAASGGGNGRGSTQGVVDQIVGEISRLQLDLDPVALAGKRTGHNDVTLDPRRDQPKHARGTLQLWIKVWVDDLFLPSQPRERLFLVETLDRLLAGDSPIAL